MKTSDWATYLASFHEEHAGITEQLLSKALAASGLNPYDWIAGSVNSTDVAVDLGCGSGPMAARFPGWVGVDISVAELTTARSKDRAPSKGRPPVVAARAEVLPIADGSAGAVIAAMSFMVVDDPAAMAREAARILRPGGQLAVLIPTDHPLTTRDRLRYAALLTVLGRTALPFPHRDLGRRIHHLLGSAGFDLTRDETCRFAYRVDDDLSSDLFVDSLYLLDVAPRRIELARALVRAWRNDLGLPLRRILAERTTR